MYAPDPKALSNPLINFEVVTNEFVILNLIGSLAGQT